MPPFAKSVSTRSYRATVTLRPASMPSGTSLLDLPVELRIMIYGHVFGRYVNQGFSQPLFSAQQPALTKVNRQIRNEAVHDFYLKNWFAVRVDKEADGDIARFHDWFECVRGHHEDIHDIDVYGINDYGRPALFAGVCHQVALSMTVFPEDDPEPLPQDDLYVVLHDACEVPSALDRLFESMRPSTKLTPKKWKRPRVRACHETTFVLGKVIFEAFAATVNFEDEYIVLEVYPLRENWDNCDTAVFAV